MLYDFMKFHIHKLLFLGKHDEIYAGKLLIVGLLIPRGRDFCSSAVVWDWWVFEQFDLEEGVLAYVVGGLELDGLQMV